MLFRSTDLAGGFPHSDIFGSMLVRQLPEAFRRLPRPSSTYYRDWETVFDPEISEWGNPVWVMPYHSKLNI